MSETLDIGNTAAAVTTCYEPTANLRWNEGILEQLVIVHATSGVLHTKKKEWRPVPGASS